MEHNANDIIPSFCHLPVSCRSLVDWYGSLGVVRHRFNFISFFNIQSNYLYFYSSLGCLFCLVVKQMQVHSILHYQPSQDLSVNDAIVLLLPQCLPLGKCRNFYLPLVGCMVQKHLVTEVYKKIDIMCICIYTFFLSEHTTQISKISYDIIYLRFQKQKKYINKYHIFFIDQ